MTLLCEAVVALGLSIGACEQAPINPSDLPTEDKDALAFSPPPPKEEPKPEPPPAMPPIIIERTVEVLVEPEPLPEPEPEPEPLPIPQPDPFELALQNSLYNRGAGGAVYDQLANDPALNYTNPNGIDGVGGSLTPPGEAPKADPVEYQAQRREASGPLDNSRIFTADRYIIGILETGINTQLSTDGSGQTIIQVARDTFGYHGRNILIPKGSRLICDYSASEDQGASRFSLECNRMLTGGQRVELFQIASAVGDQQGYNGLSGEVDDRFFEKYETAIILGGISATVQGLASLAQNSAGSDSGTTASGAQEAAANLSERFGEITASSLEQTVDLKPIIRLSQGTRVQIRPKNDWYFPPKGKYPALDVAKLNGFKE